MELIQLDDIVRKENTCKERREDDQVHSRDAYTEEMEKGSKAETLVGGR